MRKITKNNSDIFVKKIVQKWKIIITKTDLEKLWIRSWGSPNRLNYALTLLANQGIIVRVANNLYLANHEGDIDIFYWEIASAIVWLNAPEWGIVGAEKALEWQMMNAMPPQKLVIFTKNTTARMRLADGREVHFRTITSGTRSSGKNLFPIFKKYSQKSDKYKHLYFPDKEVALLEALSLHEKNLWTNEIFILQFLKRNHKNIDTSILAEMVNYGYIRAINRLRVLTKNHHYPELYATTLQIIKKNGASCFVSF